MREPYSGRLFAARGVRLLDELRQWHANVRIVTTEARAHDNSGLVARLDLLVDAVSNIGLRVQDVFS